MADFHKGSADLLADLAAKVAKALVDKAGLPPQDAEEIGIDIAEVTAHDWGGQVIYVPKNFAYDVSKKHLEIYEKFTGRNHAELASEYNMAMPTVYRILRRVQARLNSENQSDLFGAK